MEGKRISIPWTTIALALIIALALPWAVWADQQVVDNDIVAPGNQNILNLMASPGATVNASGHIVVSYQGSKHLVAGTTVNFAVNASSTTLPSGYSVSSVNLTCPNPWTVGEFHGTSNFSFTAPTTPGSYSYQVQWDASGYTCQSSPCLTGNAGLTINLSVTAPSDTTPPTINCTVPDQAIWYAADVNVPCTASDASGLANPDDASFTLSTSVAAGTETASANTNSKLVCDIYNNCATAGPYAFKVDKKAPVVSCGTADSIWHANNQSVACTASDGGSGLANSADASFSLSTSVAAGIETDNAYTNSHDVYDAVGNFSTAGPVGPFKIDRKAPYNITWSNGPADGSSYYFGFVPAAPTCSATDDGSGLASCVVSGYSSAVGSHTMTATATDNVGNQSTATRTYTVLAWTLYGFYRPVDPDPTVWNTVKGGSTVPLKFEIFAGPTELTLTSYVSSFVAKAVACPAGGYVADPVDFTTTGSTALRYDLTDGQFIQNWQTPKKAGSCYEVTMTTQDGSTLSAKFLLK